MAPRSWAQIVKGKSEPASANSAVATPAKASTTAVAVHTVSEEMAPPPGVWLAPVEEPATVEQPASTLVKPGARGSLECFCRGEVLSMLSHYGWLQVFGGVDHPMAAKHFGRVYIHSKDVVDGHVLVAGDAVSFYLYADDVGLGAEECRVEPKVEEPVAPAQLRADAVEFVPGAFACSGSQDPVNDMFVRMSRTFSSIPANGYVQMVGAINFDDWSDADSSEDGDLEDADGDKESLRDDSDHSSEEDLGVMQDIDVAKASAPWKKTLARLFDVGKAAKASNSQKMALASSSDWFTSAGMTSDSTAAGSTSESDCESRMSPKLAFRLPPGLEDLVPIPPLLA